MARNKNTDFFSFLRSQGLRKRVAKALSDLEAGGKDARGNAEKVGRRVIADLRGAADQIEQRLNLSGAAKKATKTRKRTSAKRRPAAKKTTARKTTARKAPARKTTARKTTGRKTSARKTTARKSPARKATTRKSTPRKSS